MLEKIVQNFMGINPSRQIAQSNSVNKRNQNQRDYMPDLMIRKVKSQSEPARLMVSIWETQSTFQMFDYQNDNIKSKEYKLDTEHDIYIANIDKRHAKCIITKGSTPNQNIFCGNIERSKGHYYFVPGTKVDCYRVIGNDLKQSCSLKAGDLIRIGRMRYFIKQIFDGKQMKCKLFQRNEKAKSLNIKSLKSGTCKFCLCDQKDNPDLLISPCNCKGSCAQVHLQCLKQWLSNKVSRKSTQFVQFLNYDNFSCELCKQDLPTVMNIDGKSFNMLSQNNNTKDPYIVLEGIPNHKSSTKNNLTIKINFKQKQTIILGRGHEADVRLEDVSISRQHCLITISNGCFELMDNNSKFGTLIKIEQNQKINLNQNKVQVARMTFEMTKPEVKLPINRFNQFENKY